MLHHNPWAELCTKKDSFPHDFFIFQIFICFDNNLTGYFVIFKNSCMSLWVLPILGVCPFSGSSCSLISRDRQFIVVPRQSRNFFWPFSRQEGEFRKRSIKLSWDLAYLINIFLFISLYLRSHLGDNHILMVFSGWYIFTQ